MEIDKNRWFAVVNLLSGSGKCKRDWQEILDLLVSNGVEVDASFTEHKYHAIELTYSAIERGYRKIISVGGDGTIHEVANGIMLQKFVPPTDISVGVIPVGTGNDWGKMYDVPTDYSLATKNIATGREFLQDVGKVTFVDHEGKESSCYFANNSGVGMSAAINSKVCQMKGKGRNGKLAYMTSMGKSILSYSPTNMKIWIDDKLVKEDVMLNVTTGMGRYNGGGIMPLPEAVSDDGLFEIMTIDNIPKGRIVMNFPNLYNGKILTVKGINGYKGRKVRVESIPAIQVESDGEMLGTTPAEYELIEKTLKVIIP